MAKVYMTETGKKMYERKTMKDSSGLKYERLRGKDNSMNGKKPKAHIYTTICWIVGISYIVESQNQKKFQLQSQN